MTKFQNWQFRWKWTRQVKCFQAWLYDHFNENVNFMHRFNAQNAKWHFNHIETASICYRISLFSIRCDDRWKKSWNSLNEIIHNFYFMRCSIVDFFLLLARNVQMPPRTALATTNSNKLERKLFNENCVNQMYYINSGKCAHSTLLVDLFTSLPTVEMKWWHIDLSHFLHTANVSVYVCVSSHNGTTEQYSHYNAYIMCAVFSVAWTNIEQF